MTKGEIKKLAIIAGSGVFPRQVYDAALKQDIEVEVVGFAGETDPKYFEKIDVTYVKIHKPSKLLKHLKTSGVSHVTMAGKVRRVDLSKLIFDIKGAKLLAQILKNGLADNDLLSTIINFIEAQGFKVMGAEQIASDILAEKGNLTKKKPSQTAKDEIKKGFKTLKIVASTDVGQALVIQSGLILGIEAAEGTDELIKRCGEIKQQEGDSPILLKMCKPSQDNRVDLPCIGPKTIETIAKYGFGGIAIEAGSTIILEKKKTLELADKLKVFICGV